MSVTLLSGRIWSVLETLNRNGQTMNMDVYLYAG